MNNKMTLEEVYSAVADIRNSLYNLKKTGCIDLNDFSIVDRKVLDLYQDIKHTILNPGLIGNR